MASHPIVHVDFPAEDPAAAAKFYEEALGWQLSHDPTFDYWMFSAAGGPGGGFVGVGTDAAVGTLQYEIGKVLVYLGSEDIDADLARVEARGGRTVLPRTDIPGVGWFAVFADPSGNHLGFFKSNDPTS